MPVAAQLSEDWHPGRALSDTHVVSPLTRGLYRPTGRYGTTRDYNYLPFKQSKMFAAGVTCGDCHEPHSAKLRRPAMTFACDVTRTHSPQPAHHHHETADPESPVPPAICRREITWSSTTGTITASGFRGPICRRSSAAQCLQRLPCRQAGGLGGVSDRKGGAGQDFEKGFPEICRGLPRRLERKAGHRGIAGRVLKDPDAPAIARASALAELGAHVSPSISNWRGSDLSDPDPMVRIGALDMLAKCASVSGFDHRRAAVGGSGPRGANPRRLTARTNSLGKHASPRP